MSTFRLLKLLVSGLHKIPPSALTLYRGVAKSLSQLPQKFEKGKSVVWWAVTSTASHVSVLENPQFMGKSGARCLFTVSAVCARDIQRVRAAARHVPRGAGHPGRGGGADHRAAGGGQHNEAAQV